MSAWVLCWFVRHRSRGVGWDAGVTGVASVAGVTEVAGVGAGAAVHHDDGDSPTARP
jgi:hypothetical protein